jgi:5-methylcytosine-specific restriction enzyme A
MPIRLCNVCRENQTTKRGKCDDCRHEYERERSARRRTDLTQGRAIKVYHSKEWLMTRRKVLDRDPICVLCDQRLATEVDHITPMSQGGDEYSLSNLRGLCGPCHWRRHARGD